MKTERTTVSNDDKFKDAYPEYSTPKSIAHCLRVLGECRQIRNARLEQQRKMTNRHGKLRK